MTSRAVRPGAAGLLLGAALIAGAAPAKADDGPAGATYDCGIMALYLLMNAEGRSIGLRQLEANLPPPNPHGYSLKELRDAASSLDLPLDGVKLAREASALTTPALAYLHLGTHGHYVLVRPVGHTGRLVQLIDSNRTPEVVDAQELLRSHRWTGLVLIPHRKAWAPWFAILPVGGAALVGLSSLRRSRRLLQNKLPVEAGSMSEPIAEPT